MDEIASADITRAQELIYELKIEQVMTKDVITCAPDLPIRDLKELLRVKRISGVPVVSQGPGAMISIENLISPSRRRSLQRVRDHMTERCRR